MSHDESVPFGIAARLEAAEHAAVAEVEDLRRATSAMSLICPDSS
jgi:hypothetical protein